MTGDSRSEDFAPDRDRMIARMIVEEFRPVIRQEVANGMLAFHQRLDALEEWKKTVDAKLSEAEEPRADVTGKYDLAELQRRREEAESRVQRKMQRLEMQRIAAIAIQAAEKKGFSGWMRSYGWKALGAGLLVAWSAFWSLFTRHR